VIRHRGVGVFTAPTLLSIFLLSIVLAAPAGARSLLSVLFGEPPDSLSRAPVPAGGLDSLNVTQAADLGHVFLEEIVETQVAGGDAALTGVEGVPRGIDLTGAGRGRTTLSFDGLPAGDGLVHWDNFTWLPVRALSGVEIHRSPDGGSELSGAGGHISAAVLPAGDVPQSAVAITGGSFGHRLAEIDFARKFGSFGFHADLADYSHAGFGVLGPVESRRGFGKLTFPLWGFDAALAAVIGSGETSSLGATGTGLETTAERRFSAVLRRGTGPKATTLSLLRRSSRIVFGDSELGPELSDNRWRAGFERGGALGWGVDAAGELERVNLFDDGVFDMTNLRGGLGHAGRLSGNWGYRARLGAAYQEPARVELEPSVSVSRRTQSGHTWFEAGRTTGMPAILLHEGPAGTDGNGLFSLVAFMIDRERMESHWNAAAGVVRHGKTLGGGLEAGGSRASSDPGYLSPSAPFDPPPDPTWRGRVDGSFYWTPRRDLVFELHGGYRAFDRDRQPFQPNLSGSGSVTLRRDFFERDLHLSVSAGGALIGERNDLDGIVYPTSLVGQLALTGRIRSLTLFWRIENLADQYIESDLIDDVGPVAMPGLHNRIGATLRLVD